MQKMCCSGTQWSMSNCETTVKTNCWEQLRVQHIHYQAAIILSITVPSIKLISWEMPLHHWRFCFSAMEHMAKLNMKMAKMIWQIAKYGQLIQTVSADRRSTGEWHETKLWLCSWGWRMPSQAEADVADTSEPGHWSYIAACWLLLPPPC